MIVGSGLGEFGLSDTDMGEFEFSSMITTRPF